MWPCCLANGIPPVFMKGGLIFGEVSDAVTVEFRNMAGVGSQTVVTVQVGRVF
jgi:hypothetical protein